MDRGQRTIATLTMDFDVQPFAWQPLRHINRAGGDTIATRAHTLNQDFHAGNRGCDQPKAFNPVCARPRINACTSCVPS